MLIIDDNAFNTETAQAIIGELNPNIVAEMSFSGESAIEMCQENFAKECCNVYYNLIITDIYMGEVDGISAAEEITKLHSNMPPEKQ